MTRNNGFGGRLIAELNTVNWTQQIILSDLLSKLTNLGDSKLKDKQHTEH